MELLRHGRATGHMTTLEDGDFQAGARKVPGADQAIVPSSDDENVLGHDAPFAPDSPANDCLSAKSSIRARRKVVLNALVVNAIERQPLAADVASGFMLEA
jgi:hypothetical protein